MRRAVGSFLFLGCIAFVDSVPGSAQDARVRDSAGVEIITASVSDRIHGRLSPVPVLSIGLIEGPEALMFSNVRSAAWNADGNLVIADLGSGQIRTFSSEGELLGAVGRHGEGPGEFLALSGAWPRVDGGVVAMDERLRRITEFGPSGEVVHVSRMEGVADAGMLRPGGPSGTRSLFSSITTFSGVELSDGATVRPPVLFVRHRLDGTMLDTISYPDSPRPSRKSTAILRSFSSRWRPARRPPRRGMASPSPAAIRTRYGSSMPAGRSAGSFGSTKALQPLRTTTSMPG